MLAHVGIWRPSAAHGAPSDPHNAVLYEVLSRIGEAGLGAAACVCRRLRQVALSDQRLWCGVLRAQLGDQADVVLPAGGEGGMSGACEQGCEQGARQGTQECSVDNVAEAVCTYRERARAWRMSECRVRVGAVLPADYSPGVMQRNGCAPCPTNRSSKIAAPAQSLGRRQWAPRYLHRACAMPNSRFVVIFGGQGDNQTFFNDIRVVDVREPEAGLAPLPVPYKRPAPRCSGTLTLVRAKSACGGNDRHAVVLFGGSQGATHGFRADMWALELPDWLVCERAAAGRSLEELCADTAECPWQRVTGARSVGSAGTEGTVGVEGNIDALEGAERPQEAAAAPMAGMDVWPSARWGHAAACLPSSPHLIIFGGSSTTGCFSDVWAARLTVSASGKWRAEWEVVLPEPAELCGDGRPLAGVYASMDGVEMARSLGRAPASPQPRAGHTMVSLGDDRLIVCGGNTGSAAFNDLWCLHVRPMAGGVLAARWELLQTRGKVPSPRVGHAAVRVGSRMVVLGGRSMPSLVAGDYASVTGRFASTMHVLDLDKLDWSMPTLLNEDHSSAEEKRTGHALACCEGGLLVIGGLSESGHFCNDMLRLKFW